jgi:hypothetical protein
MRTVLIAAAAIVALAGPADAAAKHKWFILNARTATCEATDQTPEAFQSAAEGPQGHLEGVTADTIAPGDVSKDADGNIHVKIRGTDSGQVVSWAFYTSRAACDLDAKAMTPEQAPSSDIN